MDRPTCELFEDKFQQDTIVCDQKAGEVLWLPNYWWHETCGMEDYSIGMGAVTYEEDSHREYNKITSAFPMKLKRASIPSVTSQSA